MGKLIFLMPHILQGAVYPFTWIAFRVFAHMRIIGREYPCALSRGVIFAANHVSQLDPILIPATLKLFSKVFPMYYTSLDRSFYAGTQKNNILLFLYGGFFFKIWGAYPIMRGMGDYEVALAHHIRLIERGKSVTIFPEGKKSRDGSLGEGKPGVAYLAWRTGVPVVPVALMGHHDMGWWEFFTRRNYLTVTYGAPISRDELFPHNGTTPPTQEELKEAAKMIMERIKKLMEEGQGIRNKY